MTAEGSFDGPDRPADKPRRKRLSPTGDWRDDLIRNADGVPRSCLANAVTALRAASDLAGILKYNEFSDRAELHKAPPWAGAKVPRDWSDHDDLHLTEHLQRCGVMVGVEIAAQAAQAVASEATYHPVRDKLDGLHWDGTERLDFWLHRYLSARPSMADLASERISEDDRKELERTAAYVREVGRRFLISAVARIYDPGCKADCILVLEGGQGIGKSKALRTLTVPWFTDQIAEFGSREAGEQCSGIWLVEVSELESVTRAGVEKIKAFASRGADRYRPAYGRRVRDFPRQCVFAGTVNRNDYLRDETGARRFWPVQCGRIDIERLEVDRDQLWAEAVAAYRAGEKWWLSDDDMMKAAAREQDDRYHADPWHEPVAVYLAEQAARQDGDHQSVTIGEILENAIKLDKARQDQSAANRIARILRKLDYQRFQSRATDGRRVWMYRPSPDRSGDGWSTGDGMRQ